MLNPIETEYNRHRFRSRLEARWAVFMDTLGVQWEYEKEGFDLGDGTRYLPDFWLPELNRWVEIKGSRPNAGEVRKAEALAIATGKSVVILWGPLADYEGWIFYGGSGEMDEGYRWCILERGPRYDLRYCEHEHDTIEKAIDLASKARFEFGETPIVSQLAPAPRTPPEVVDLSLPEGENRLTITLRPTGDKIRDTLRLRRLHGIAASYQGMDEFEITFIEGGELRTVDFPGIRIKITGGLVERLKSLVGPDNVKIEQIPNPSIASQKDR
jgi:hypothetical protein